MERASELPSLDYLLPAEADAYLIGAAHDSCWSHLHRTTRFTQKDRRWLEVLAALLRRSGYRSWMYREGKREVYCLETSWKPLHAWELKVAFPEHYLRGYFDAEGGIPASPAARFYIQFVQKDLCDLTQARCLLEDLGIDCGRIHNPSARVDPDYWRFYLRSNSHRRFVETIGSWHPRKRVTLMERFDLFYSRTVTLRAP